MDGEGVTFVAPASKIYVPAAELADLSVDTAVKVDYVARRDQAKPADRRGAWHVLEDTTTLAGPRIAALVTVICLALLIFDVQGLVPQPLHLEVEHTLLSGQQVILGGAVQGGTSLGHLLGGELAVLAGVHLDEPT